MSTPTPALLVLTGASGAGKTTLINGLESARPAGVACFQCDVLYDSLPDEVRKDGMMAQDAILSHWVTHVLSDSAIEIAALEPQIRPHRAQSLLARVWNRYKSDCARGL